MIKAYEYFLDTDVSVSVKSRIQELDLHLKKIEENLLEIILASQKGKLGINKIGNKIRLDSNFNQLISEEINNNIIIKFFENRRSFQKIFMDYMYECGPNKVINFLILGRQLNRDGRIVDRSAISILEVEKELEKIFKVFKSKEKRIIRFIEIISFDNYIISENQGYSKFIKLNHA